MATRVFMDDPQPVTIELNPQLAAELKELAIVVSNYYRFLRQTIPEEYSAAMTRDLQEHLCKTISAFSKTAKSSSE